MGDEFVIARLYLMRHGIAVPHGTPDFEDDDRPLTEKGIDRVKAIARRLDALKIKPDRIVSSPLPRAGQTAEIVADGLGLEDAMEFHDAIRPGRSVDSIREWLSSREEKRILLVGHNPSLSDLLGVLLECANQPPPFELKKAGVAALRSDEDQPYRLQWLATPRLLRRPGH